MNFTTAGTCAATHCLPGFLLRCLIVMALTCASCSTINTVRNDDAINAVLPESEAEKRKNEEDFLAEKIFLMEAEFADEADIADATDRDFYKNYSEKMGINFEGWENKKLIASVSDWLGVPYKWGGCSKKGIDCSCFVKLIYKEVYNIGLYRNAANIFHKNMIPVQNDLEEGDILSFKIRDNRISHIGIYIKDNKFAHVSLTSGVRISNLKGKYYKKRFYAAGRMPKLKDKTVLMASSMSNSDSRSGSRIRLKKLVIIASLKDRLEEPFQHARILMAKEIFH